MPVIKDNISYRVADVHAHVYPRKIAEKATQAIGNFYDLEMDRVGLASTLYDEGKLAGIDRFLICSVATKLEQMRSITDFIARTCSEYSPFLGLAAWHQDAEDIDGEFDYIMKHGLHGIKLHPDFQRFNIDEPKMLDVYREATRRGLVVLFHTGDDRTDYSAPSRLARVVDKIPEFTCIAAHLGGYRSWKEAAKVLHGSNVYVDTSSSLFYVSKEDAKNSIRHFGVEHTLFGTDFPMWTPALELDRFFALDLSPEENKAILYDNFARLFKLN
ncbi:MAG: amidohydrolase family protein [Kiritimatiellae bacterium]|nr:amidohydrolase family protein [Kiritimatiellia bacterium]